MEMIDSLQIRFSKKHKNNITKMTQNSEYDFEDTGDLVCWDTVYYETTTSNKKINIIYTQSEKSEHPVEHKHK